jgi:glycosyltransferase 2 family protein
VKHRSIIVFTLLSIIVFTALAVYGDLQELIENILALHPLFWLVALGLTLVHILVRLARWEYYLRVLGISADARTSALVFLSGLSMIMVPGRVGELAKSYLLKQKLDTPIRLSAPVIITERIGDVISVLLLGLWGLVFIPFGWALIAATLIGIGAFLALLASPKGVSLLVRLPLLRRWEPVLSDSGRALRTLFSLKVSIIGLLLGCLAWFILGFAFWIVLAGLGTGVSIPIAVSIFCATTLLGSITMLPGGLVTTEGSMLVLLQRVGLGGTVASAAILTIRVCTLWFAVLIGLAALLYLQKRQPAKADVLPSSSDHQPATPLLGNKFIGENSD